MKDAPQPLLPVPERNQWPSPVERVFQRMAAGEEDPLHLVAALMGAIRPMKRSDDGAATRSWQEMNGLLAVHPGYREAARTTILSLFSGRKQRAFYTEAGLLPNTGFFSELRRKLAHKVLPELIDEQDLKDCVHVIFPEVRDQEWMASIPLEDRVAFWKLLGLEADRDREALQRMQHQLLDAVLILSHRIAAMGLEPELLRVNPRLTEGESPFIGLSVEVIRFVGLYRHTVGGHGDMVEDERHLLVLLDQCRGAVARAHQVASSRGTSMTLTFLLVRLSQNLDRFELLVRLLAMRFNMEDREELALRWSGFLSEAMEGERLRNSIRRHFSDLMSLLALRVTENAGNTGEHYIASNRSEWLAMWRAAAGAGLLIAVMALLKIAGYSLHWALLNQAILNSFIYGSGFVIIHLLHFTIATKQPAMTAATIAGSISQIRGRLRDLGRLADLVVATARTQMAAISGNVLVAMPIAIAIGTAEAGRMIGPEKARHLLHELDPLASPALFYAAVAGVWLFVSGLVSGYVDNIAAYSRAGARIAHLPWLRRIFGPERARRIGAYLEENAGGLSGNLFFGFMLGMTPAFGVAFGLPLDIRHVAFSSANLGYALTALDFRVDGFILAKSFAGVVLIGMVNLAVSFTLALWVAMRSRGADFSSAAALLPDLWSRFRTRPASFFMPLPEKE